MTIMVKVIVLLTISYLEGGKVEVRSVTVPTFYECMATVHELHKIPDHYLPKGVQAIHARCYEDHAFVPGEDA